MAIFTLTEDAPAYQRPVAIGQYSSTSLTASPSTSGSFYYSNGLEMALTGIGLRYSGQSVYFPHNSSGMVDSITIKGSNGLVLQIITGVSYDLSLYAVGVGGGMTSSSYFVSPEPYVLSGNDLIYGNSRGNYLFGHDGNDTIFGDAGNDEIDGGAGFDTLDYSASSGIVVNLNTGFIQDGFGGTDTVSTIEQIIGSSVGSDMFTGGSGIDYFAGLGGDDYVFSGGGGNDVLDGGDGFDTVSYYYGQGAIISLGETYSIVQDGEGGTDTVVGFEVFYGSGSYRDVFFGNGQANIFYAFGGNDYVSSAGAGDDFLDGGEGFDAVSYYSSPDGVTVNLLTQQALDGYGYTDTIVGFEEVYGSASGSDVLIGDHGANALFGFGGDDLLVGMRGQDTLTGGYGNDTFGFNSADFEGGVWDVITDFSDASGNKDALYIFGVTLSQLLIGEANGGTYVSTVALGGTGGFFVAGATQAEIFDQFVFA